MDTFFNIIWLLAVGLFLIHFIGFGLIALFLIMISILEFIFSLFD